MSTCNGFTTIIFNKLLNTYLNFVLISSMVIKVDRNNLHKQKLFGLSIILKSVKDFWVPKCLTASFDYSSFLIDVLQFTTKVLDVSKSFTTVVIVKFRNMCCFVFSHHLATLDPRPSLTSRLPSVDVTSLLLPPPYLAHTFPV